MMCFTNSLTHDNAKIFPPKVDVENGKTNGRTECTSVKQTILVGGATESTTPDPGKGGLPPICKAIFYTQQYLIS